MTRASLYRRRKLIDRGLMSLCVLAAAFGLSWLGFILFALIDQGLSGFSFKLFVENTPVPGEAGGLANAIVGSVLMCSISVLVGTPVGLMAGTYLAEYGRYGRAALIVRFVNDILLSAPSIVIGLFIYELMVPRMGNFSGWAGAAALTVIVIPVVVRTTENMLLLVPNGLREAAVALGAPRNAVIRAVTWRAARAGILTGVLLAIARISGETAPLLFTALSNQWWSTDLNAPMASLPVVIFNFANSAYDELHRLAWQGALLITVTVLTLSIVARILETSSRRTS
ncbi:MAG: phosphate ABC transporter permease PstA [Alphaproteobacteria bacterium]|nr:phosphate ABC transporter permease PstA [Alphaproteobacteria bacterium]